MLEVHSHRFVTNFGSKARDRIIVLGLMQFDFVRRESESMYDD